MSTGRHPVRHVNADHADDLLAIAQAFGGHTDATSARADRADERGIDLVIDTPGGTASARVDFAAPVVVPGPEGMRTAFAEVARRARAVLAGGGTGSSTDA